MSLAVDDEARKAQVTSAKKKLRQFRASRSGAAACPESAATPRPRPNSPSPPAPLNTSVADNKMATFTMPRRLPQKGPTTEAVPAADDDIKLEAPPTRAQRHTRKASRSHHRRDSSVASFTFPPPAQNNVVHHNGLPRPSILAGFDLPLLVPSEDLPPDAPPTLETGSDKHEQDTACNPREIIATPATPVQHSPTLVEEELAIARLGAFSFGAKPQQRPPPSFPLPPIAPTSSRNPVLTRTPSFPPDLGITERPKSRPTSPSRRKRHSHNRSESISLPNLKLGGGGGRPNSLGLPSPSFTSAPSSPFGEQAGRSSSRLSTPLNSGSRLKFEPSDKEKEESRRRALDKLTGGPRFEEQRHSITLPSFDDDDYSVTSSRPPTLHSTASSSRPSSLAASSGSFGGSSLTSPLPWSTFEETDRWSFPHRFDPNKEDIASISFELPPAPSKTSSVLLNSGLGVLAEEDETESDEDGTAAGTEMRAGSTSSVADATSPTDDATPTPSRLRELHLVSTNSSRRGSNPEVRESFARTVSQARETPTKGFGSNNRRPRPLGLDEASVFIANSATSPNRVGRSNSLNGVRRAPSSRGSSISYKKDDSGSGSSRDYSIRGIGSPPTAPNEVTSPTITSPQNDFHLPRGSRPSCPRPRSLILGGIGGTSGRVLGEVDEEDEDSMLGFRDDGVSNGRPSFESSRDSLDSSAWARRRDSRDRIDAEMERDALREDVDLWRKRCRNLEDQLETERRETSRLRERVRKLGDRILQQSSAHAAGPSPNEGREIAQSRLIAEMRDQIFSLASALERERTEKAEALSRAADLQSLVDVTARTPQVSSESLPTTPKVRPRAIESAQYDDADSNFADADDEQRLYEPSRNGPIKDDPNLNRMRGWGFPQGPVDSNSKASKRDSFFGLSRARPVRAPKASGSGLGLAWPSEDEDEHHDLPPIVVDDTNRSLITPVSPSRVRPNTTALNSRVASEPSRRAPEIQIEGTPERPTRTSASVGGFGLSFLSGYLTRSPPANPSIPRIAITPSSVSPKRTLLHLERDAFNARIGSVARGCHVDFRECCSGCSGDVLEL